MNNLTSNNCKPKQCYESLKKLYSYITEAMHWSHEQLEGMINKQDVCRTNKVLLRTAVELHMETVQITHLKMLFKEMQHELNTELLTTNPSTWLEYGQSKLKCIKDAW